MNIPILRIIIITKIKEKKVVQQTNGKGSTDIRVGSLIIKKG